MSALRYGPFMVAPDEAAKDAYVMNLAAACEWDQLELGCVLADYAHGAASFEATVEELGGTVAPVSPIGDLADFMERQAEAFERVAETPAGLVPLWFQRLFCRVSASHYRRAAAALRDGRVSAEELT